jgi:glycosyltransferase involved in cell wall biosynthesis
VKIVFFEGDLNNSITGFRKELVNKLACSGYEVVLVGFRAYENEFGAIDNNIIPYQYIDLGKLSSNPIKLINAFARIFLLLLKIRPNLCLSFNIRPVLLLGLVNLFLRIPSIATITGTSTISKGKSLKPLVLFLSGFLLKYYKVLFFQNNYDKKLFTAVDLSAVKIKVVPGSGVDTNHFAKNKSNIDDITLRSDFLLVSRIIKQKGILEYIEAAREIKKKFPQIIFGLLGPFYENSNGNYIISPEQIKKSEEEGIIKYFGFSRNVKDFMLASKCIVLPTYGEGMSNTLLEAASLECPLLASNVPGCKEIVDHEVTGYLFEKESISALVDVFNRFLQLSNNDRVKMGVLGRKKIVREFDKSIVLASYIEEIQLLTLQHNQKVEI